MAPLNQANTWINLFPSPINRSVNELRLRTLDAVEAITAYERVVAPGSHFVYNGDPYLEKLVLDVRFLDHIICLTERMKHHPA